MLSGLRVLLVACLGIAQVLAQKGDRAGEAQGELPAGIATVPAPVRTPTQELATFCIAEGLRIELVAAEPLIGDPVQAVFDERGRLWVVEMRGFMRDADGQGESAPLGRIVVLSDRDGDGVMDDSVVFLDRLVLPRALAIVAGGILVLEPPHLWFFPDADGDLKPEGRKLVASGFDAGISNPEHAANGLVRGIENWIECANWGVRLRWQNGAAQRQPTFAGGQWGICFDDFGRRYYDYNSDFLRVDTVPASYATRWPAVTVAPLWNQQVVTDQSTWPIHPTPGVNRGYQKDQLRADLTLRTCTAACAPLVDRGGSLPPPYAGSAFVCEPAGNLVARFQLATAGLAVRGTDPVPGKAFLASTDERFRPVNLGSGPDGALYVVDMYRGLIQHKNFVTTFLRKQVDARELARPTGLGRIWRVTAAGASRPGHFDLTSADSSALVAQLANQNGFVRDQAQRLLVERRAFEVRGELGRLLRTASDPRTRLHALWTLEGLDAATPLVIRDAFADANEFVRAAALRVLEGTLAAEDPRPALRMLEAAIDDASQRVRIQAALTIGASPVRAAQSLLARLACKHGAEPGMATAIATGCAGRAAAVLQAILATSNPTDFEPAKPTIELVARAVALAKDHRQALECVRLAMAEPPVEPILEGLERALPKTAAECLGLLASPESTEFAPRLAQRHSRLAAALTHKRGADAKLPATHERRRQDGALLFAQQCSACHQQDGRGLAGLAPSLHDASLLQALPDRAIRIVMHGLAGPLQVGGETWNLAMPGHPLLDDEQIAAIVTFVRGEYARREEHTTAEDVRLVRERHKGRTLAWSADELQK